MSEQQDEAHDHERDAIWVRSKVVDGGYQAVVEVGEHTVELTEDKALRWAQVVLRAAMIADHDAANMRLLHEEMGLPLDKAATFVAEDLRPARPDVDNDATAPLVFGAGVAMHSQTRKLYPYVGVQLEDKLLGKWSIADAHHHAQAVLEICYGTELDTQLYQVLIGQMKLDEGRARMIINGLGQFLEDPQGLNTDREEAEPAAEPS